MRLVTSALTIPVREWTVPIKGWLFENLFKTRLWREFGDLDGALCLLPRHAKLSGGFIDSAFRPADFRPNLGRNPPRHLHPLADLLGALKHRQFGAETECAP